MQHCCMAEARNPRAHCDTGCAQLQVPCTVSAIQDGGPQGLQVGSLFATALHDLAISAEWDGFGEQGEFHTLARVWEVERHTALAV